LTGNLGVWSSVLFHRVPKFLKYCHEIHDNRMVAT
jgi:hypothetical protein